MSIDSPAVQSESFPYKGTITREQFSLVQRMLLPWWGTMRLTTLWIVIGALVFAVGDHIVTGTLLLEALSSLFWATAMIVYVWGLTTYVRHRQWRRVNATQQDITGNLGKAGIEWNTPMITAKFPWSKIVKIRQHPEMLLIFYSSNCAFYVPKHFFATETAWSEANALALRQLPSKSKRIQGS